VAHDRTVEQRLVALYERAKLTHYDTCPRCPLCRNLEDSTEDRTERLFGACPSHLTHVTMRVAATRLPVQCPQPVTIRTGRRVSAVTACGFRPGIAALWRRDAELPADCADEAGTDLGMSRHRRCAGAIGASPFVCLAPSLTLRAP
jgi:hypothetical protein